MALYPWRYRHHNLNLASNYKLKGGYAVKKGIKNQMGILMELLGSKCVWDDQNTFCSCIKFSKDKIIFIKIDDS